MSEPLFRRLGFNADPFAYTNADLEDRLKDYFVPPPFFSSVTGDFTSPSSCLVLAPRGAGKTAQRKMVEAWSLDKPVLCVTYDRFEFGVGQKIDEIGLPYHLRNIITKLLLTLLTVSSDKPEKLSQLPREVKRNLSILCHSYLGTMTGQAVGEAVDSLRSIPEKIRGFWSKHVGLLESVLNFVLKHYGMDAVDLPDLKYEEKKLDATYKYQLGLLREIANTLGYQAIYILIDKVDETELTGNDAELTYRLVEPMLKDLDLLGTKGFAFKFFLWDKTYDHLLKSARPDRIPQFSLNWSRSQLEKILSERIKAFSNGKVASFSSLFKEKSSPTQDEIVTILGWHSPRNLIRFCSKTLSFEEESNPNAVSLSFNALDRASVNFSIEIATELYGHDTLRDLKRTEREVFTVNYLANDVFKTSHENTSRNKLTEWQKCGAVKKSGTAQPGRKPSNLYYIEDPRVNRVVHENIPLEQFFMDRWMVCETCHSDVLIKLDLISTDEQLLCPDCQRPIP